MSLIDPLSEGVRREFAARVAREEGIYRDRMLLGAVFLRSAYGSQPYRVILHVPGDERTYGPYGLHDIRHNAMLGRALTRQGRLILDYNNYDPKGRH